MLSADPSGLISPPSPIDQPGAPVSSFDPVSSTFTRVSSSPAQTNTQYCVFASRCTELALNGAGRPYFLTVYLFTPATGPSKVAPLIVGLAIWSLSLGRPFPWSPYTYTYTYTGSYSRLLPVTKSMEIDSSWYPLAFVPVVNG